MDMSTQTMETKTLKLHFFYITLILSGIIIVIATRNWTNLTGFTEYLSVAATITSLVLGILAIIYSFVSSNSTTSFLGSVETSAKEMGMIGSELQSILTKGQALQESAGEKNEELHELIKSLRFNIETLTTTTAEMVGKVDHLPERFDTIKVDLLTLMAEKSDSKPSMSANSLWPKERLKSFIKNNSAIGVVVMKAIVDAKQNSMYSNLKLVFGTDRIDLFEYAYGFLICAASAEIFTTESPDEKDKSYGICKIKNENPEIYNLINEDWSRRKKEASESSLNLLLEYEDKIKNSFVNE